MATCAIHGGVDCFRERSISSLLVLESTVHVGYKWVWINVRITQGKFQMERMILIFWDGIESPLWVPFTMWPGGKLKVCGPYVVTHINIMFVCESGMWQLARIVFRNEHQKVNCFDEIELCARTINTILGLIMYGNVGRVYVIFEEEVWEPSLWTLRAFTLQLQLWDFKLHSTWFTIAN